MVPATRRDAPLPQVDSHLFSAYCGAQRMPIDWTQYQPGEFFDELFAAPGAARPAAEPLTSYLASLGKRELAERQGDAERAIAEMGITFTVYTEGQNIDRAWPFDVIPRTIEASEWARIERGLIQRLTALNHFIDDLYHDRRIIADGVVPEDIIATSVNFLQGMHRREPAARRLGEHLRLGPGSRRRRHRLRARGQSARALGRLVHAREPDHHEAGVSGGVRACVDSAGRRLCFAAVRHARVAVARARPIFRASSCSRPVSTTPRTSSTRTSRSAWASTSSRARTSCVADDDCVYMRTIRGLERVDVIYRRINDTFLDPECSTRIPCSACRGSCARGAPRTSRSPTRPGAGVADDKVVYAYVPKIIKYYLRRGRDPAERADARSCATTRAAST